MKRTRVSSIALRWILAACLPASPLLAEYPPQSDIAVPAHRPAVRVVDENNEPLVGTTVFSALLTDSPSASRAQPDTQRNGKELGTPRPSGNSNQGKAEPGGKTFQTLIIAALIAGGVVALILLLGDSDHKKSAVTTPTTPHTTPTPPAGVGTVLVPGTPIVSSPH